MDITLTVLVLLVSSSLSSAQTIYGCRYNQDLCNSIQSCEEDNLFGTCWSLLKKDPVLKFHVTAELKKVLVYSLQELLLLGYHWTDEYTQCIIGGLLQGHVDRITPELIDCDAAEQQRLADINTYLGLSYDNGDTAVPSNARLPFHTTTRAEQLLSGLSSDDLKFIENYLSQSRPPIHVQSPSTPIDVTDEEAALSETDQWLLEQLALELISVDDLSTSQIKRLKSYLQAILDTSNEQAISGDKDKTTTRRVDETSTAADAKRINADESSVEDSEIEAILRKFSAEAMNEDGSQETSKTKTKHVVGQQISDQMRLMEQEEISAYVDKKSASVVKTGRIVEAPDKAPELTAAPQAYNDTPLALVDTAYVWIELSKRLSESQANSLVGFIAEKLNLDRHTFTDIKLDGVQVLFEVSDYKTYNTTEIATIVEEDLKDAIQSEFNVTVEATGIGNEPQTKLQIAPTQRVFVASDQTTIIIVSIVLVVVAVAVFILLTWRCMYKNWSNSVNRFEKLSEELRGESTQDSYEDLCRQRMHGGSDEKQSQPDLDEISPLRGKPELPTHQERLKSPRSSTSSWSDEPVSLAMDISTGHTVLAYMEDHLKNSERLEQEWTALCDYTPDRCDIEVGKLNAARNRYASVLPYDYNRVKLEHECEGGNYINASFVTDSDPRSPAYIATQGLMQSTVAHFWQMIWEQESTSIVMLTSLAEDNKTVCYQYWPSEGRHTYGNFEVHLVSEHIWCEAYIVRSLYLKNLLNNETRTVTQFHFLSWPDLGIPEHCEELLAFRRKVNKSYRGKTSPIIVCCSDGSGRCGTYILLDTVINRIHKGVKEIDIAATLEHIRDQRMNAVQTKEQFEFVLSAIAEEVQALLKALPQ